MILLFSACVTIAPKTFLNSPNWSVEKFFFPGEIFSKKGIFAIKKLSQHQAENIQIHEQQLI